MKRFPFVLTFALVLATGAAAAPVRIHSLLDLTAATRGDALATNWDDAYYSNFDPYRLRVFAEATPSANFEVDVQALYQETPGLRLIGAYVQYTPWPSTISTSRAARFPGCSGPTPHARTRTRTRSSARRSCTTTTRVSAGTPRRRMSTC
jgi:hypothetical protein